MARFREVMGKMQINITVTVLLAVVYLKNVNDSYHVRVIQLTRITLKYFYLISRKHCLQVSRGTQRK